MRPEAQNYEARGLGRRGRHEPIGAYLDQRGGIADLGFGTSPLSQAIVLVRSVGAIVVSVANGGLAQLAAVGTLQPMLRVVAERSLCLVATARERAEVPRAHELITASHHVLPDDVEAAPFVRPIGALACAAAAPADHAHAVVAVSDFPARMDGRRKFPGHRFVHTRASERRQGVSRAVAIEAR
jgi:hypothetical protein